MMSTHARHREREGRAVEERGDGQGQTCKALHRHEGEEAKPNRLDRLLHQKHVPIQYQTNQILAIEYGIMYRIVSRTTQWVASFRACIVS